MNEERSIHVIALQSLSKQWKEALSLFDMISFNHVYMDMHTIVDSLWKEGLHMKGKVLSVDETTKGVVSMSLLDNFI